MLEDRQHNALAALDIFQNIVRADSLSGDVARWQRAFDEAKREKAAKPTPPKNDAVDVKGLRVEIRELFDKKKKLIEDFQAFTRGPEGKIHTPQGTRAFNAKVKEKQAAITALEKTIGEKQDKILALPLDQRKDASATVPQMVQGLSKRELFNVADFLGIDSDMLSDLQIMHKVAAALGNSSDVAVKKLQRVLGNSWTPA